MHPLAPIEKLWANKEDIIQEWLSGVLQVWSQRYPGLTNEEDLRKQSVLVLDALALTFAAPAESVPSKLAPDRALVKIAREYSVSRAMMGFKAADTAQYIFVLKNVLTRHLVHALSESSSALADCLRALNEVLEYMSLQVFESFIETREKVISQQSLSIQELTTPVVRLWDQVLLLPLVGVIDTTRARQFTESLLMAISRYEAIVTIIDVTGVPVFDTSVARHIMKSVDAAQLLGSRIVMTGISPESAQTLTKLGLNFSGVTCRASLRAGVAEALQMIGKRIVNQGVGL